MKTEVPFTAFMDALAGAGVDATPTAIIRGLSGLWSKQSPETRRRALQTLGLRLVPETVTLALSARPKTTKELANVKIIISGEDAPAGDAPAAPLGQPSETAAPAVADPPAAPTVQVEAPRERVVAPVAPEPPVAIEASPTVPEPEAHAWPPSVSLTPAPAPEPPAAPTPTPAPPAAPMQETAPEPAPEAGAMVLADAASVPAPARPAPAPAETPARPAPMEVAASASPVSAPPSTAPSGVNSPSPPMTPASASAPAPAAGQNLPVEQKKGFLSKLTKRSKSEMPPPAPEEKHSGPITVPKPLDASGRYVEKDFYAVQEPYAYIRVVYDKDAHEHIYEVIEPELDEREKNILAFIEDTLVDVIEVGLSAFTTEEAAKMLKKHVDEILFDYSVTLTPLVKEKVMYYILRDFLGFGILDPIMRDDLIEDVSCDGPEIPIFLYHRKFESVRSNVMFPNADAADSYVIRMAQRSGKHISIAEPLLDATLPDGSRLNATLSDEVTANGSTFTIRKFRDDPFTPTDLVRFGTMNADILAYWWLAVQNGASAIYAGGTASGKTTSLNAILLFIPPQMKIVSIEDTREINIPHENWIAGVTRAGFGPRDNHGRQAGEIDMFTLLKAALRQRPEYILVGEVRGQEATALFQAMATGHTAYGTMHADSAEAVIHRLESEPISIPRSLLEALDIVSIQIQTRINGRRVRRTKELIEIVGLDPHTREILTNEVFSWNPATDQFEFSGVSYVLERIQLERNMTEFEMRDELQRRKEVIEYLVKRSIRGYQQVGKIISEYYKDAEGLLQRIREAEASGSAGPESEATSPAPPSEPAAPAAGHLSAQGPQPLLVGVTKEGEGQNDAH